MSWQQKVAITGVFLMSLMMVACAPVPEAQDDARPSGSDAISSPTLDLTDGLRGSVIGEPYLVAPDFALQKTDGTTFRLEQEKGKVILIYLGYTRSPDFDLATLSKLSQVAELLGDQARQVEFLFITVDPDRDSPDVLAQFMEHFPHDFIALTGSPADLEAVWLAYGAGRSIQPVDGDLEYAVAHSTRIWAVDTEGRLRATFPFEITAMDIAHDVMLLLSE